MSDYPFRQYKKVSTVFAAVLTEENAIEVAKKTGGHLSAPGGHLRYFPPGRTNSAGAVIGDLISDDGKVVPARSYEYLAEEDFRKKYQGTPRTSAALAIHHMEILLRNLEEPVNSVREHLIQTIKQEIEYLKYLDEESDSDDPIKN